MMIGHRSTCVTHLLVPLLAAGALVLGPVCARAEDDPEADRESSDEGGDGLDDLDDLDDLGLDAEFALLQDEAVVELAARHKQDIGMSPSAVTVITREDIATSGARTIPDLLRLVPGMDVVVVSPFNTSITSRIHWTYENNVYLVLIDGREANNDLLGQAPWEVQPIALEDIERIEIIRGPGSSLYGANAFAGVISITTRALPDRTSVWAQLSGGESGTMSAAARGGARIGSWGFSVSAGANQAVSYSNPREDGVESWRMRGVGEYRISDGERVVLDIGASWGRGRVPTGVGPVEGQFDTRVLRLAYESEDLRAQLYWQNTPSRAGIDAPLKFFGQTVAEFVVSTADLDTLDAEIQYSLPTFYDPLLLIVGATGRVNVLSSDDFLDPSFLQDGQPGVSFWEARAGAFLHAEWTPADWVTVTGGARYDYNTETGHFVSPRLASVFQPAKGHFIRLGAARAFRRPAYLERRLHVMLEFPDDSFLSEATQDKVQELMLNVLGNPTLGNETMWSFEAGYLGRFLDGQLSVSLDGYYSMLRNMIELHTQIVDDPLLPGLPDLDDSSALFEAVAPALDILGLELAVRYSPVPELTLLAAWSHKEIFDRENNWVSDDYPKNLITLGGRFLTRSGVVGSLYFHTRSEFTDRSVDSPDGVMAGYVTYEQPNVMLVLARLGYQLHLADGFSMEAGARLFLPVTPFGDAHVGYHERGGGITPDGRSYGGERLIRLLSLYLQGTY